MIWTTNKTFDKRLSVVVISGLKVKTFAQHWANVDKASRTSGDRCSSGFYIIVLLLLLLCVLYIIIIIVNSEKNKFVLFGYFQPDVCVLSLLLNQCWVDVGPAFSTLVQYWARYWLNVVCLWAVCVHKSILDAMRTSGDIRRQLMERISILFFHCT